MHLRIKHNASFLVGVWLAACGTSHAAQTLANDHFTNAIVLEGNNLVFGTDLSSATLEAGESSSGCAELDGPSPGSAWWRWTATNSSAVIVVPATPPTYFFPALDIFTGSNISNLTSIACMRIDTMTNRYVAFAVTSGMSYYFRALGRSPTFAVQLITTNRPIILATEGPPVVRSGAGALFGVMAAGIRPLSYQWRFRGNDLPCETTPTLLVDHLTQNSSDGYSVIVSNMTGVSTGTIIAPYLIPGLQLKALRPAYPTNLDFEVTAVPKMAYVIDSSTNLIDWNFGAYIFTSGITNTFSITRNSDRQFVRAHGSLQQEECISHLAQVYFAVRLWTIENQADLYASPIESDLVPYMRSLPICPSGGTTFSNSYLIGNARDWALCKIVPAAHWIVGSQ